MPETPDAVGAPSSRLRRRTLVGAAAWSAPAIALSVASPAAATSLGAISLISATPIKAGQGKSSAVLLTPAAGGVTVSFSVEPAGSVSFEATTTSIAALNGLVPIRFDTTLTEAQTVSITVTAPGYLPLVFPLEIEAAPAPAPVLGALTLSAVDATVNLYRKLPMVDGRQDFTAHFAEEDGAPGPGKTVTLTAPAGTTFSNGQATISGLTDAAGDFTATLVAPPGAPASTKTLTAATTTSNAAKLDFIVIGPVETIGFRTDATTDPIAFGISQDVYVRVPEPPLANGKASWGASGFTPDPPSGTWLTTQLPNTMYWAIRAGNGNEKTLDQPVPARTWTFELRNTSGSQGKLVSLYRMALNRAAARPEDEWETVEIQQYRLM